jgi:hypothetical protein
VVCSEWKSVECFKKAVAAYREARTMMEGLYGQKSTH